MARIRKQTHLRLRQIALKNAEDMVDLLDVAVLLLERELAKSSGEVARPDLPRRGFQIGFGEKVTYGVDAAVRQTFELEESEVRYGD